MGRNEGDENLKSLGDILGGYTWGNICMYFQQRTCRFEHLDSCTSKAALRAALASLEINYVNSCGWRDRIEGGKQPLSGLPWPECGNAGLG